MDCAYIMLHSICGKMSLPISKTYQTRLSMFVRLKCYRDDLWDLPDSHSSTYIFLPCVVWKLIGGVQAGDASI